MKILKHLIVVACFTIISPISQAESIISNEKNWYGNALDIWNVTTQPAISPEPVIPISPPSEINIGVLILPWRTCDTLDIYSPDFRPLSPSYCPCIQGVWLCRTKMFLQNVKHIAKHNFILTQHTSTDRGSVDIKIDHAKALYWSLKSAEQGYAPAQYLAGRIYYEGTGTPKDDVKAFLWMQKSAEQGHAPAQDFLGDMYLSGIGTAIDEVKALFWKRKAAEQGYPSALEFLLGYM